MPVINGPGGKKPKPKPVDPVRDRPQDPGHGTPPVSDPGGGGRSHSPYRPGTGQHPPGSSGGSGTGGYQGTYRPPPAWVIRRQQILHRAGLNVGVDGVWGPQSQHAWAIFTKGITQQQRAILRSGQLPHGFVPYKGRLVSIVGVRAAKAIHQFDVGHATLRARGIMEQMTTTEHVGGRAVPKPLPDMKATIEHRGVVAQAHKLVAKEQNSLVIRQNAERLFGPDGFKTLAGHPHQAKLNISRTARPGDLYGLVQTGVLDPTNAGDVRVIQEAMNNNGAHVAVTGQWDNAMAQTLAGLYSKERAKDYTRLVKGIQTQYFDHGLGQVASIDVLGHTATAQEWAALFQKGGSQAKALVLRAQKLYQWSSVPLDYWRQDEASKAFAKKYGYWHDGPISKPQQHVLLKNRPWMFAGSNANQIQQQFLIFKQQQKQKEAKLRAAKGDDSWGGLIATTFNDVSSAVGWASHEVGRGTVAIRIFTYSNAQSIGYAVNDLSGDNLGWMADNDAARMIGGLALEHPYGNAFGLGWAVPTIKPAEWDGKGFMTPHEAWIRGMVSYDQWAHANPWQTMVFESVIDPLNFIGGLGVGEKLYMGSSKLMRASARISAGADRAERGYQVADAVYLPHLLEDAADVMEGIASLRLRAGVGFDMTRMGRGWRFVTRSKGVAIRHAQQALESIVSRNYKLHEAEARKVVQTTTPRAAAQADRHAADVEALAAIPIRLRSDLTEAMNELAGHFSSIAPQLRDFASGLNTSFYRTLTRDGLSQPGRVITAMMTERANRLIIDTLGREIAAGDKAKLAEFVQNRGTAYAGFPHPEILDRATIALDEFRAVLYDQILPDLEDLTGAHALEHLWDGEGNLIDDMTPELQFQMERLTGWKYSDFTDPKKFKSVTNPMHGRATNAATARRMMEVEIDTRKRRLIEWSNHRMWVNRHNPDAVKKIEQSVIPGIEKIKKEVTDAWAEDGRGVWTDMRSTLDVPEPYARPGTFENPDPQFDRRAETYLTKKMDDLLDSGLTTRKMRTHIQDLATRYKVGVRVLKESDLAAGHRAGAWPSEGHIQIEPIKTAADYYVALHEMAHVILKHGVGEDQTGWEEDVAKWTAGQWESHLKAENEAARWAVEKMGVPMTDETWLSVESGLQSYYRDARASGVAAMPSDAFLAFFANPEQNLRDLISASNSIATTIVPTPLGDGSWVKYARMLARKQVLSESAKGYLTPALYRQQGLVMQAMASSQHRWARGVYRTMTFGLSNWKFATLPGHFAAYPIRNEIDNYTKMMIEGHVDPRRWFNPDGKSYEWGGSIFDRGFRELKFGARVFDQFAGTNLEGGLRSLEHYFFANHRDLLDKVLAAHDFPKLPDEYYKSQRNFYENLVKEQDPRDLLMRKPSKREPTRWERFTGVVWDLFGTRPENAAKRALFYSSYGKSLKKGLTEVEAWDKALEDVDRILFNYDDVTILEDQLKVLAPFILFWRKNANFWQHTVRDKPWFIADAQRLYDAHASSNNNEPDWMQRYLNVGVVGGALRAAHAGWLADWAVEAYADPMSYSSVTAFYRAFKQQNPILPSDQQGWDFIGPLADAFQSVGLGMNPFLRTAGENFGVFSRRSWVSIFPQTQLLASFTEMNWVQDKLGPNGSWYKLFGNTGFNWEQVFQDKVLGQLGMTQWHTLTEESFQHYVDMEIANQVAQGQPADRERATEKIRYWFAIQGMVAFVGGLYTRHISDTDVSFYAIQQEIRNTNGDMDVFKGMSDRQRMAYQLESKVVKHPEAVRDPEWFDNYVTAVEGARTFYNLDDWDAKQQFLHDNPDVLGIVDPIVSGHIPDRQGWMRDQLLILQGNDVQHLYYDVIHNPEVDTGVKSAAYGQLVTPELKRFWARNDTPEQRRQSTIKGAFATYVNREQSSYFAIPEKDQDARKSFIAAHPELQQWWIDHNSMADDWAGIIGDANATFRDVYFRIVDTGDWDKADAFLKAHSHIFDFTSAEGRVTPDGGWVPRTEAQRAYAAIANDLREMYALPHSMQQGFIDSHPLVAAYFRKYAAKGTDIFGPPENGTYFPGGLSQHAKDYLAIKPILDVFFTLDDSAKNAYLDQHPELRAYFAKYAHQGTVGHTAHGMTQHARDYLAIKPVLDAFFALPEGDRSTYLAKHPELQKYFDKYGSHKGGTGGVFAEHIAADPEIHARYTFWMEFFKLPPDKRPAFVHNHAADAGIFLYGSLSYDDQIRKEARWRREALAHGMTPRAEAFLHVKPLLDIFFSLKSSADKTLFTQTNPELEYYFQHYAKHTGVPADILPVMETYFQLQPYSDERRTYLEEHPELQRFFSKDATPHEKAITRMVDAYFSLPSFSKARDDYLLHHPELAIWFDAKQKQHQQYSDISLAFNEADPRMKQYYAMYADIIPMDAIKRFELAWTQKHPVDVGPRIDRAVDSKGESKHKPRSSPPTSPGKKAGELTRRTRRSPL